MPVIPQFDDMVQVHPGDMARINPAALAAPGEALARGADQFSNVMDEFNQRYQEAKRATNASDTMVGAEGALQDLGHQTSLIPDRDKAFAAFNDGANELQKQYVDPIADPQVKAMVQQRFNQTRIIQGETARQYAFKLESANSVGDLELQSNDLSHRYAAARNDLERAQIIDTMSMAIKSREASGYMTGEQGAKALIGFRARADAADATRDIDADPKGALDKLNDDANYPNMDEYTRGRLIARAESKSQRTDSMFNASVRQRFTDNVASIQQTGEPASPLSEAEMRKAFPGAADVMMQQLNLASGLYQATKAVTLTSQQQDESLIGKWQPKGTGFENQQHAQDILQKAVSEKWKQIGDDPAGYVLSASPEVLKAFQAAATPSQDPRQQQQQVQGAVTSLDAAYDKLGLAPQDRAVMTGEAVANLARKITSDPTNAAASMKDLQSQYGQYWPRAWHDLVTVGKLPASYQAVGMLDSPTDQVLLSRWLGQQQPGQQQPAKAAGELLGEKNVTAIKNSVRNDPSVQALTRSLSDSGASVGQVSDFVDAIDNLAFAKNYYTHSPQAALDAISAFTSKYEFMPNGGARVPRDRYADVQEVAADTLHNLTADKIAVPSIYGSTPAAPKPEEYLDQLRAAPTWITAPTGDALWLKDPGGRFVRNKDGSRLAIPFSTKPGASPSIIGRMLNAISPGGATP